jgi:predicted AAA+ superfamily ATPase
VIARPAHLKRIGELLEQFPVVGLIGARQVGKTTLAQAFAAGFRSEVTHFDLENPRHLNRLEDALFALENLQGLARISHRRYGKGLFPVV